jgi:hypothetical protein
MNKRLCLGFIGLLLSFSFVNAQSSADRYANMIKAKKLKEHVYILASDSCAGRNVGTSGIEIARNYIINQWNNAPVLKPYFNESWVQSFSLVSYYNMTTHLKAGNFVLTDYKDYLYTGKYDGFEKEFPIVFAGYGSDSDFEEVDVEGKAVFVLNKNLRAAMKNARIAHKYGAELTIVANPENRSQFESISNQYKEYQSFRSYMSPDNNLLQSLNIKLPEYSRYIIINSMTVKKLTNRNLLRWKNTSINEYDSIGTVKISIEPRIADTISEKNIVAFIPGANNRESIVVGAHYDHLGVVDNKIYYGADDNASGVAALLELSRIFSNAYEDGYKPQKNIIFIAFSAEEGGLWGSKYFAEQLENKDQIKLMINIDMIGRAGYNHSDDPGYFYFIGNNLADSLYEQNKTLCKEYNLTPDYSSTIGTSDHKSFSDIGIPTIFYFDGKNQDLHEPTDTPNKVNYKRMEGISRMIFETIWRNAGVCKNQQL